MTKRIPGQLLAAALLLASAACAAPGVASPVALSGDHRSFLDANGRPSYWQGDTLWELFTSYSVEEAEAILEDRRAKGFNAVQVMLLGVKGAESSNPHGEKPFLNGKASAPNPAYFEPIDAIVKIAEKKNLTLVIGVYHKSPHYSLVIPPNLVKGWGEWVGRRYREAPNVIWSMYPVANAEFVPIIRDLAAGLAEGDQGGHLITVHPDPSPASSSWIHQEKWLSFNTLQSFKSDYLNHKMVAADYARLPVKPVVNGEARYEDEGGTTPLNVRNGAWWSCLAGGFYSYGHGGNWMKPKDWKRWLDSPASRQMKVLGDFFRSLDWWNLVPDLAIVSGLPKDPSAARSANRDWALLYLASGGQVTVVLEALKVPRPIRVSWLNPATGALQDVETTEASGSRAYTSPGGWADALLILDGRPGRPKQ